jgi:hypothetical protein
MKLGSTLAIFSVLLLTVSCGLFEDVNSKTYSVNEDAGCTNNNCPPVPDAGCTNNNCPPVPDAGCTNNNCPPGPDAGCTNNNCPPTDAAPTDAHVPPPFPVCCIPVDNVTLHLCCGQYGNLIACRLSTIPDHVVIHDVFLEIGQFCRPEGTQKNCKPVACRPDWWPEEAEDVVFPAHYQCNFWESIKECKGKGFVRKIVY